MYIKFTPYHFCTPDRGKSLPLHSPHSLRSPCNKTNRLWPTSGLIHLVLSSFAFHSYLSTPHFAQTCLFQFNPNLDLPLSSFHVCLHFSFSFIKSERRVVYIKVALTIYTPFPRFCSTRGYIRGVKYLADFKDTLYNKSIYTIWLNPF